MSNTQTGIVKQLRAVIEEDQRVIRNLREEVDRLRYLLGLHSLQRGKSESGSVRSPSHNHHHLHLDFSN